MFSKRLSLVVTQGFAVGLVAICESDEPLVVGRGETARLIIFDLRLSREHFVVRYENDRWVVADLDSQNGTQHNGRDVVGPVTIADRDTISAGDTKFEVVMKPRFRLLHGAESATQPKWISWFRSLWGGPRKTVGR